MTGKISGPQGSRAAGRGQLERGLTAHAEAEAAKQKRAADALRAELKTADKRAKEAKDYARTLERKLTSIGQPGGGAAAALAEKNAKLKARLAEQHATIESKDLALEAKARELSEVRAEVRRGPNPFHSKKGNATVSSRKKKN